VRRAGAEQDGHQIDRDHIEQPGVERLLHDARVFDEAVQRHRHVRDDLPHDDPVSVVRSGIGSSSSATNSDQKRAGPWRGD